MAWWPNLPTFSTFSMALGHFIFKLHELYIFILFIFIFILGRYPQALIAALADPAAGHSWAISLRNRRPLRTLKGRHEPGAIF